MSNPKWDHQLEELIVDLTEGKLCDYSDIKTHTGLSEERCKEMENIIYEVFVRYYKRTSP